MVNDPEHEIAQHGKCFADWLNLIDATIGYDERRSLGNVALWREYYDADYTAANAIYEADKASHGEE